MMRSEMPWRCPACQIPIKHSHLEESPRLAVRYRCHICRLELMLNSTTNRLDVAPLTDDGHSNNRERPTS
jgi:hypothetical protein